ncbi:MAG: GNAT family N-acetyltransferase, partial [Candidatus Eremiobacteraeota bacterium]|nr:GNAT family N-acetyltransferase [Candidatus Eremiobacteraeota bacterium]
MNEPPFPAIVIRRAEPGDAKTLGAMRAAQQSEIRGEVARADDAEFVHTTSDFFARELAVEATWLHAWVAVTDEGLTVGSVVLIVVPTIPRGAEAVGLDGRIRNVYVAPPFRRNGLARRLTLVAVERARELGVGRLALGA